MYLRQIEQVSWSKIVCRVWFLSDENSRGDMRRCHAKGENGVRITRRKVEGLERLDQESFSRVGRLENGKMPNLSAFSAVCTHNEVKND
jgi:hypothetical protein